MLKARFYKWDADKKYWHKTVTGADALKLEVAWLKAEVYGGRNAKLEFEVLDGLTRFSKRPGKKVNKEIKVQIALERAKTRGITVAWKSLVKTSHLLAAFPEAMIDSEFFDRFRAYVPDWEIPKMRPEFFTNRYGLIVDYLAEYLREMRKQSFADAIEKWFKLGNNLNQRDTIAVHRATSGLLKLVCPNGEYTKDSVRKCLKYALNARRRIKEQLKKIGGMKFYDVHFSYIDLEDGVERFVTVPEQSGGALVPEGRLNPGTLHTISMGKSEMPGIYQLKIQSIPGNGKANVSGVAPREAVRVAFDYFKANSSRVSASIKPGERDFHTHLVELQNSGAPQALTLAGFIALCSAALGKPVQSQLAVMGDMSLGGTIVQVRNLAECMQVAFDAGAKRILLPMSSVTDIASVPGELFAKF